MNHKQRKAKSKRANQHRYMAKTPEYQANWENRHDKWVEQMKEKDRFVSGEGFPRLDELSDKEKRIELIKEVAAAIIALVFFVALLGLIYLVIKGV